ncbi:MULTISPECIES: hypothetical protein [unclassified Arsukibacterium]|uniref:hypothetical protein n=1 Tax=unclassified Arsukibacterium TaxID=2635278 RepID=UPI000C3B8472|nr:MULTISPECIES: hypothetical protein [unclassified Arsukibacterium]MAA93491.1 hypothetical protein [Rheinheimera sp.]MBM33003.1 hypothetical protein [Rheinheimera sp.]HAW92947.1 hypothetical protein [Candidatus Azambacteria bacterium]|tara:strand:- start:131081 stop:132034 length:954 start_codon:yes stop_codon:yes gene_type:complete
MNKLVVGAGIVVVAAAAGFYYANSQAENAIKEQIELANKSYAEMAASGLMPAISIGYQDVAANVLTSSYSVSGVDVSVAGMGQVATIEKVTAAGLKPKGLADKGSAQLIGAKVAEPMLAMLPPQMSEFVQGVVLHADYSYQYTPANGELYFSQVTRVNDEFSLAYNFSFAQMQELWAFARDMSEKTPEEQQALSMSDSYMTDVMANLVKGALKSGELVITNDGFIERLVAMASAQGQMPPLDALQGMALMAITADENLPLDMKESLTTFINQPEKLQININFAEPVSFEAVQSGALMAELQTPEQMIEFANLKMVAN